jgi:cytochrome b561
MQLVRTFMQYLRERQPPLIRHLHLTILVLVISQIIVSNFMGFTDSGAISKHAVEFYGTWLHLSTGLFIIPVALGFLTVALRQRGFKYYFPYLTGEFSQLTADIRQLMKLELPEASAYGLAATVQGLGFGALLLVLISGLTWFLAWNYDLAWSDDAKEAHEFLTGVIQAYLIGHGGMGLFHIYLYPKWQRRR